MSKDIYNVELIELLPLNLRLDPDILAASKATDKEFKTLAKYISKCLIYVGIDEADEDILDLLAWEMHTDFYDVELPIDTKREIVKNSLFWHRTKGTPSTIEELITTVFGDGEVEEWFQYDGKPYHFRIKTSNPSVTGVSVEQFRKAVNNVKRKSTRMDEVIIVVDAFMDINYGFAVHTGTFTTIRQGA